MIAVLVEINLEKYQYMRDSHWLELIQVVFGREFQCTILNAKSASFNFGCTYSLRISHQYPDQYTPL